MSKNAGGWLGWMGAWLAKPSARIGLALLALLATSQPATLPGIGLLVAGSCVATPSVVWLQPSIKNGEPQQTVELVFKVTTAGAMRAPAQGSTPIADTSNWRAQVSGTRARTAQAQLRADNTISVLVAVPKTTGAPVPRMLSVTTPYGTCSQTVRVPAVTQWKVYVSQFGHPDPSWCSGTTFEQERVRHAQNQIVALDQISATLSRPFENRQRFEADDYWQFDEALKENPVRANQFKQYIQDGYYGINPMYAPLLVQGMDTESLLQSMLPYAAREREWNLPKRNTVSLSEIPESTWGMASLLKHAGIDYFARGILYTGGIWGGDMPAQLEGKRVFWWQGPDGEKVLARMQKAGTYFDLYVPPSGSYATDYATFAAQLNNKAAAHETSKANGNYAPDALLIYGTLYDCQTLDASYGFANFINDWNNDPDIAFPKIVGGNQNEFFEYVAQNFGDQLPTFTGGFDTQWSDGLAFHVTATTQFRANATGLLTAQKLAAIASTHGLVPQPSTWLGAIKNHALVMEHSTYANGNSCQNCPRQQDLQQLKINLAQNVLTRTQAIASPALNAVTSQINTGSSNTPEPNPYVVVFNPLAWQRSAPITITVNNTQPLYLTDLATGNTLYSQLVAPNTLLFVAPNVPSLGYKVFRLEGVQGSVPAPFVTGAGSLDGTRYTITTSMSSGGVMIFDKLLNKQWVASTNGYTANQLLYTFGNTELLPAQVSTVVKFVGPVAAQLQMTGAFSTGNITAFTQTVTLFNGLPTIAFENAIHKNASACTPNCPTERVHFAFPMAVPQADMRVENAGGITNVGTDLFGSVSKDFYGVQSFADVTTGTLGVTLASPDSTLVSFGGLRAHTGNTTQPASGEMFALAHLNDFDVSDAMQQGDMRWHYALLPHNTAFDGLGAVRFGWEQRTPMLTQRLPANQAGVLPSTTRSYGTVTGDVVLSAFKPADNGNGFIVRLWNPTPITQTANLDFSLFNITQQQQTDGLERNVSAPFAFANGGTATVRGNGFVTLRLIPKIVPVGTPFPNPTATKTSSTQTPVPTQTSTATTIPVFVSTATATVAIAPSQTAQVNATTTRTATPVPTPTRAISASTLALVFAPLVFKDGLPNIGVVDASGKTAATSTPSPAATATLAPTPTSVPTATAAITFTATPSITAASTATATPTPVLQQAPPTLLPTAAATRLKPLPVLDDFNRPNGVLSGTWISNVQFFLIQDGTLIEKPNESSPRKYILFNHMFATTQEASVKFAAVARTDDVGEMKLILKQQPTTSGDYSCNHIEVWYDTSKDALDVLTCDSAESQIGITRATFATKFVAGDVLRAKATSNGKVDVYKNETLLGSVDIRAWDYYGEDGQMGLWLKDVPTMALDDFSGE